ncbi:MAG: hypothetical protein Q4G67_04990 [Actinomycetia bacterium]|nr:hypothetical protein [Actinomycetes bacterium]
MDRKYLPLIALAVIIPIVFVVGVVLLFAQFRATTTPPESVAATMTSEVVPEAGGVRVTSTLTASGGVFPAKMELIDRVQNNRLSTPDGNRQVPTSSDISQMSVDGAEVEPGTTVEGGQESITVSYLVAPDGNGDQLVTVRSPLSGVRLERIEAHAQGSTGCVQPDRVAIGGGTQSQTVFTVACDSPAVATDGPRRPGSDVSLPMFVQFRF